MSTPKPIDAVAGNPYRIRDPQASSLIEIWLISAVVSILVIRGYLHLTGYPQVGGGELHIAHMLWGGLGMVVAFGMLVIFAHQVWKPIAVVIGGMGFGAFIDELGKFITEDNDYFYRPTIALIYLIMVVLFMVARYLNAKREPTEADHLFMVARGIQWQAIGKLDDDRQKIALDHLDASGNHTRMAEQMRDMLQSARLVEESEQSRLLHWRQRMVDRYWRIVRNHWIERIVIGLFVLKAIQIVGSLAVGISSRSFVVTDGLSFEEWGTMIAATGSGLLALAGVVILTRHKRVWALHAFVASTLLSLLFGQFFAFASNQFLSFGNLVLELVIFSVLRFALSAEEGKRHDTPYQQEQQAGIGIEF